MDKQKHIPLWLKAIVSAGLLWFFISRTDIGAIGNALASIPVFILLAAALVNIASVYVNAVKWKIIAARAPFAALARANFVAQYYSLVLPGQIAGEFGKLFYLKRHGVAAAPELAASITVDKATGLVGAVFIVGAFGALMTSYPLPFVVKTVFVIGFLAGLALIFLLRVSVVHRATDAALAKFRFEWLRQMLAHWREITAPVRIAFSVFLGVIYQLLAVAIALLIAVPLGVQIGFFDWCWILSILSVILLIPVSIGGLGLREGSLVAFLGLFGVMPATALAFSLTLFGLQIPLAAIGAFFEHVPVKPAHENH